jgi:hypothetical protein
VASAGNVLELGHHLPLSLNDLKQRSSTALVALSLDDGSFFDAGETDGIAPRRPASELIPRGPRQEEMIPGEFQRI